MKSKFSKSYQARLLAYLKQPPGADLQLAQGIGQEASAAGLETLDLVKLHEQILVTRVLAGRPASVRNALMKQAGAFFTEAITPIEETDYSARQASAHLNQIVGMLSRRTVELAASNLELSQEITRRKAVEEALKKSEHHDAGLPEKSAHRRNKTAKVALPETRVPPASRSFPVIAMAASVGGLKALSVILGGLPADFPAAVAIVMHLSPEHKSILAEILNSRTLLEVKQAHTGDILSPSSVFVAPPNHHLFVIKGGGLQLSSSASEKVHHARPSAEPLFASVAEVYQKNAIGVVLAGGDGDGSFGVRIIKEKRGKVIAQDRPTSQDFSMPETSIKTGDVDFILPLHEIAPKLIALVGAGGAQKMAGLPPKGRGLHQPWQ